MKPHPSLIFLKGKGKWYVNITVPLEDRPALNGKKQLRVSTGTSDKKIAERLLHDKAQQLYDQLYPIADLEEKADRVFAPAWLPDPNDLESGIEWEEERRHWEASSYAHSNTQTTRMYPTGTTHTSETSSICMQHDVSISQS